MSTETTTRGEETRTGRLAATKLLLTLLVPIVGGFAVLYVVYYRANAAYLTERNYRVLATLSNQISARLEGARLATTNAATRNPDANEVGTCAPRREKKVQTNLTVVSAGLCPKDKGAAGRPGCEEDDGGAGCLDLSSNGAALYLFGRHAFDDVVPDRGDGSSDSQPSAAAQRQGCTWTKLDLRGWLKSLLSRDAFDDIVLFDEATEQVIYQRREAYTGGIPDLKMLTANAVDLDADTPASAAQAKEINRYNQPLKTRYFGKDYMLFFQPVRFRPAAAASASSPGSPQWLLCGLVQRDRFRQEVGRIPSAWLGSFLVVVVLAALAWPTLNLMYVGPRERLTNREVRVLVASWIAAAGLVTFYMLDLVSHLALSNQFDGSLRTIARTMERRLHNEIDRAYAQLDELRQQRRRSPEDLFNNALLTYASFDNLMVVRGDGQPDKSWVSVSCDRRGVPGDGAWRAQAVAAPKIDLSDRPYFKAAQSGRLPDFGDGRRFAMDVVQARTTGNDVLVLAMPTLDRPQRSPRVDLGPEVVLVGSRLLSVMRPVLPASFGMALVDSGGDVVLHSDSRRSRVENLLLECDGDRALDAALKARHATWVATRYGGQPHEFYLQPVRGTEWTLVMFRNKSLLGALNLDITASWAIMYVLYLTLYLIGGVVAHAAIPRYRAEWLWPRVEAVVRFLCAGGILLMLAAFLVGVGCRDDAVRTLAMVVAVPALATTILYIVLTAGQERTRRARITMALCLVLSAAAIASTGGYGWLLLGCAALATAAGLEVDRRYGGRWRFGSAAVRRSYVFMLFALLTVVGAAPSLVIFLDAQAQSQTALTKHLQQRLARAIIERDRRIATEFEESHYAVSALRARLTDQHDIYWTDLFAETNKRGRRKFVAAHDEAPPSVPAASRDGALLSRHITAVGHLLVPLYDDDAALARRLQYDSASDGSWWWQSAADRQLSYVQPDPRSSAADGGSAVARGVKLQNVLPPCPFPAHTWWWAELSLLSLVAIALGLSGLDSVVRRLFLFDLDAVLVSAHDAPSRTHTWLYAYPKDADLHAAAQSDAVAVLDLSAVTAADECGKWLDSPELGRAALAIVDRAEAHGGDPAWDAARVGLLERLTALRGKPVVVLSDIDLAGVHPTAADAAGDAASLATRWAEALARLGKRPADEPDWRGPLVAVRNRRWWAQCTGGERLVLAQLAHEGFLNPNNQPMIAGLFARGLIRRAPAFELRDASFRQFVVDATPPATLAAWEREPSGGGWTRLRTPLMALLLLAVGFFLTTQREAMNWVVGLATAVTMAIPALMRVVDLINRPSAASSKPPAAAEPGG